MINNPVTNFSFTTLQNSYKHIYCTTTCTVEVSVSERVCASYIILFNLSPHVMYILTHTLTHTLTKLTFVYITYVHAR